MEDSGSTMIEVQEGPIDKLIDKERRCDRHPLSVCPHHKYVLRVRTSERYNGDPSVSF